jgi:hypothetical protein
VRAVTAQHPRTLLAHEGRISVVAAGLQKPKQEPMCIVLGPIRERLHPILSQCFDELLWDCRLAILRDLFQQTVQCRRHRVACSGSESRRCQALKHRIQKARVSKVANSPHHSRISDLADKFDADLAMTKFG